jgi:hypothetical protein
MVDIARIEELYDEVGQEAVAAVLSVFAHEARLTIDLIETSLGDAEHAAAVHFVRSGALNLGLNSLADAADAAASAPRDERAQAARDLRRILDRCAALLNLEPVEDLPP